MIRTIWDDPIYDRNQKDIDYAIELNRRILEKGFNDLTEEEQTLWFRGLKGALNSSDLIRIEKNSAYLNEVLHSYGYTAKYDSKNDEWNVESLPLSAELERVRYNLERIITAYYEQSTQVPDNIDYPTYIDINDIERVQALVREMITNMEYGYYHANTFYAGQLSILPQQSFPLLTRHSDLVGMTFAELMKYTQRQIMEKKFERS